ncbi:MAG: spore cortex biosynthesis protein YabQ [Clostridia bacterium]|nr:spore cortex biosynthesis protein YabQ [Clostridia bacterium]
MEILIRNQNKAVLLSFVLGLFVGIIYDAFKLIRKLLLMQNSPKKRRGENNGSTDGQVRKTVKKRSKILEALAVAIFDFSFCALLCPIFCVFSYITVNGRFRWFIFAAAFLGATIYKITLGRLVGKGIDLFSYAFFRFRRFLFDKIKIPLKTLSDKIKNKKASRRKKRQEKAEKERRKVVFSYGKSE